VVIPLYLTPFLHISQTQLHTETGFQMLPMPSDQILRFMRKILRTRTFVNALGYSPM
jgi:hypothetical protein